jgi:hypothetical protein
VDFIQRLLAEIAGHIAALSLDPIDVSFLLQQRQGIPDCDPADIVLRHELGFAREHIPFQVLPGNDFSLYFVIKCEILEILCHPIHSIPENYKNRIDNGGCVTYYNNITTHISYYNDYAEECK